jgi:hypothetical protein
MTSAVCRQKPSLQIEFRRFLGVVGASFDNAALAFCFPQIHALFVRNLAPVDHQAQAFAQAGQFQDNRVVRVLGHHVLPFLSFRGVVAIVGALGFFRMGKQREKQRR